MRRRSILLLDDDDALREELAEALAADGHQVEAAGDGRAATDERLRAADTLILDLSMPGIDGIDLLQRVGTMSLPLRVILISGHGDAVLHVAALAARRAGTEVGGTLSKPVDLDRLLQLIQVDSTQRRPAGTNAPPKEEIGRLLTAAVAANRIPVAYQAKVRTSDFAFAGAEALLGNDWPGAAGPIAPPDIVEAAAGLPGMLTRLTLAVAAEAARACAAWCAAGYPGPVSVNVPIAAILAPGFATEMMSVAAAAGIPPTRMTLELTEDSLYDSSAAALGVLAKLRLEGFGLSLDDVGQRQSGLVQFANLPVTEIKIDMEIVRQARTSAKARSIYGALTGLGRQAGIAVTAEGVESADDIRLARETQCSYLQGYWVARKMPLAKLLPLLPLLAPELRLRLAELVAQPASA